MLSLQRLPAFYEPIAENNSVAATLVVDRRRLVGDSIERSESNEIKSMTWQARATSFVLRHTLKKQLSSSATAETIRKAFNASHPHVPRDCIARDDALGGIRGEWMQADNVTAIGTMLYLHGGAYVACSPTTHRPLTSAFARLGWRVYAPDYRLAPEHRFPAQLHDAVAVYRALLDTGIDPKQLVIVGDSAGGNLTLALCLSLRDQGLAQPAAIALFSPVTDFAWTGDSIRSNSKRCAMFAHEMLPSGAELFLGTHDPRDPLASPYYADLKGLPPMLFHAGDDEILRDDSIRTAERAKQAGIEVEIKTWPDVPHIWQMWHRWIPEGRESLALTQTFLVKHSRS